MKEILIYIGLAALGAFVLYRIVKSIIENVKRERFRKKNREAQFSGSAVKEKKGFWASVFSSNRSTWAERIGDNGERTVSSYLADLECDDYQVFNDLLLRDGNYTTQIDHIILSRYGVFVIETKNVHGKVYGSGNAEFWKQYLPDWGYKRYGTTQEHQLRNPLWQNAGHIKSLRRLVFDNDIPIHGIVVFPYETDLYVTADQPVLKMWQVVPYIKQYRDKVLSADQLGFHRRRLLEVISTTESDRQQHLNNVNRNKERRDAAVASGKCPRCGGTLVLRTGKYGQFYGCSNYPRCNYILNK
ncbi:MAG: NERD domain-containing protein [Bacteroidales bacterium]|nr:NERD domain-containing protein [Bacteroidales bacterium]